MEWHPENPTQYQVLLTRLGASYVGDNAVTKQAPIPCVGSCALFAETNHTLRGAFLNHWQTYGGLPVYGFSITEELQERNAGNGQTYTVQYFERNRLEYHPENAGTRYEVQLGRLGAELLAALSSDIQRWPVAATPNYGETAAAPPVTPAPTPKPQPSPTPPPVQANPSVTMSPSTGAAGTKFIATGSNFPAGATVGWNIVYGGKETNSGSFQLDSGNTAFNFTISTDGSATGDYTINFLVTGRVVASGKFTVTGTAAPPATPALPNWRSLPIPPYMVLQYERPSPNPFLTGNNQPLTCVMGTFSTGLGSRARSVLEPQFNNTWTSVGLYNDGQPTSTISTYTGRERIVFVQWLNNSTVLYDCPR